MTVYRLLFPLLLFIFSLLILPTSVLAAPAKKRGGKGAFTGGSISMGLGLSLLSAEQNGMNNLISSAKTASAATTSDLGSGYEYLAHLTFKFANRYAAIQLRPAIFKQTTSGSGTGGSYDYDMSGYSVFPLARIIPLSNDVIDFFLQGGIGYGSLTGSITNGNRKLEFSGSSFGIQIGLGADFCIVPEHCFGVEGNYRYLPIVRNVVDSQTGVAMPDGVSADSTKGRELENLASGNDIATSMSGVAGILTYTFNF